MYRTWGKSYVVLTNGHKIFLDVPYDEIKEAVENGKKEIHLVLAEWYGRGYMVVGSDDIVEIGQTD